MREQNLCIEKLFKSESLAGRGCRYLFFAHHGARGGSLAITDTSNNMAAVVQGASLVNIGPSTSLMLLLGLRSLSFCTAFAGSNNRVALLDPNLGASRMLWNAWKDTLRPFDEEKTTGRRPCAFRLLGG